MVFPEVRVSDYLHWRTAGRLVGHIKRPRLLILQLREYWHARQSGPVHSDIDLSNLPEVELQRATTDSDFESVISLYQRNPSRLIIAPHSRQALDDMVSREVIFYRIMDSEGDHVGNLGYQSARSMFSYLQVDYPYRGRGYALAAELAGERMVAKQGTDCVFAQVFRSNRRALSTFFSLGWQIDHGQSTDEYLALKKCLEVPGIGDEAK